jgi:choline dehydrogenase-like flavoprotein
MSNLYVCDGSVIPGSGIANTGLTISALALRLGAHLAAASQGKS